MDLETAVDLIRQATWLGLLIGAPVVLVSLLVGVLISIVQAVTQIQEQTLSFVPRLAVGAVTTLLILPWALQRLADYATQLFQGIPAGLGGY